MIGADRFVNNLAANQQALHATQRYQRGYSDVDMWNFDILLADIVVAACDWYLGDARNTGSPWGAEPNEWRDALTEIRDGFSTRDDAGVPHPPKSAWKLLRKHFRSFWD